MATKTGTGNDDDEVVQGADVCINLPLLSITEFQQYNVACTTD